MDAITEFSCRLHFEKQVGEDIEREIGAEPLRWVLEMLGFEGYRLRVWFEPIEDEL